jgi:hypothetical protein
MRTSATSSDAVLLGPRIGDSASVGMFLAPDVGVVGVVWPSVVEPVVVFRRLIVTLLEDAGATEGSCGWHWSSGVLGRAGSPFAPMAGLLAKPPLILEFGTSLRMSTDLAGEPECEVLRRLRDVMPLSSNGFGLVVFGSAEMARSRGSFGSLAEARTSMDLDHG